jgi:hypothetical protein
MVDDVNKTGIFNSSALSKELQAYVDAMSQYSGAPTAESVTSYRDIFSGLPGMDPTSASAKLGEANQMAKLQLGLALAQRGFGSMGAQPRVGEMAISTVGREMLSPLAGDALTVAQKLYDRKLLLEAAEKEQTAKLSIAAWQAAQAEQAQKATIAATVAGKIAGRTPSISKSLQKDVYFNYQKLDKTIGRARGNVQVLIEDTGNQVLRVIGEARDVNSNETIKPGTMALNFEEIKDDPSTLYFNDGPDTISFTDPQGAVVNIAPGRGVPVSLKESVHSSLSREDRSQLREWTETPAGGTVPKEYRNVSGAEQDLSFMGLGIVAPNAKIRLTDGEFSLLPSQLKRPEFFAAEPETEIKHGVLTQVYDAESGQYLNPQHMVRTTQLVNGKLITKYHGIQQPGGQRVTYNAEDAREIVATHQPFKSTELMYVTPEGEGPLQALIPNIKAGEQVQVHTASAIGGQGGTDVVEYRYAGQKVPVGAVATGTTLFQTNPLTEKQKKAAGQTVEKDAVTRINASTEPIEVDGRIIKPGGTVSLTETDFQKLDPEIKDALPKTAAVSLTKKTWMVGGNKPIKVEGDRIYHPGDELHLNDAEMAAILKANPDLNLSTITAAQNRTLRGNFFRNHYKNFLTEETLTGKGLTDEQVDTLFALFPGTRATNPELLRKQLFKFAGALPITETEKTVGEATKDVDLDLSDYQKGVQKRHSGAEARYKGLLERNAVAIPWDQLSYQKREAFASIPIRDPRLLDPETAGAAILEAEQALQKEKEAKTSPSGEDISEFAAKARIVSLLKNLRDEDLLANTGLIEGLFAKLGANLADWPVVGSKKSGKLAFMLQQLGANLKELEVGATRPSNWRLQLVQETIPEFTTSEFVNKKNLEQAILILENDMKSQLNPSLQSTHVITPQLLRIAAEAGIKVPGIDHSRQRWLDPTDRGKPLFSRVEFLESLGQAPFTHIDFELIYPGREVQLLDKKHPNARWLKVDDEGEGLTVGKYYVIRTLDGKNPAPGATVQDITDLVPRGD